MKLVRRTMGREAKQQAIEAMERSWDLETKLYVYSSQNLGSEDIVSPEMRERYLSSTFRGEWELEQIKKSEDARKVRAKMLPGTIDKERTQPGHIWSGGSRSPANRRAVE